MPSEDQPTGQRSGQPQGRSGQPHGRGAGQPPGQRQLAPLDLAMVPLVAGGLVAWAVAGLILLALRPTLVAHGNEEWLWICVAGFLVGLPGLALMIVHDRNRRRRRAGNRGIRTP